MEERDLREIWKGSEHGAESYYREIQDNVLKKARKRSHSIFARVHRTMIIEMVLSVIVAVVFPFVFWEHPVYFIIVAVIMAGALLLSIKLYNDYRKQIRSISETQVVTSLQKKVNVLGAFVKRLNFYMFVLGPIAFFLGLSFSLLTEGELEFERILLVILFSLPFLALFIWLSKKYIDLLYKRPLNQLKEVLSDLESE